MGKIGDLEERIERKYRWDRREFGKVLLIASATMFIVSFQATLSFQNASQELKEVDKSFQETSVIINDPGFNESVEALESVKGTQLAPRFLQAAEAFRNAQGSLDKLENSQENLESTSNSYSWLVLLSIIGMVTGAVIIYL